MEETYRNALQKGHIIHEYKIIRILGVGGFGVTYLVEDTNLDKHYALKEYMPNDLAVREGTTVHPKTSSDAGDYAWGLDRFLLEARTLAKFEHPHIVRVQRLFKAHNTAYMVMDYEKGETLGDILKRLKRPLEQGEIQKILFPILAGLKVVHEQNFLHRDIKPGNILVRYADESPVLLDFGSARQAVGSKSKSLTAIVTEGYAPYEQYESDGNQGPWGDIYALAAVVYRCIAGEVPAESIKRVTSLLRKKPDPLTPLHKVGGDRYTEGFLKAMDHALAILEDDRPQNIDGWLQELADSDDSREELPRTPAKQANKKKPQPVADVRSRPVVQSQSKEFPIWQPKPGEPKAGALLKAASDMEFVWVPSGAFQMGDLFGDGSDDEKPVHEVELDGFWIGTYPITQGQWEKIMGSNPSHFKKGDNYPVETVSWDDTQKFLEKLNQHDSGRFRLPTEAEWEYACRSGGKKEKYAGGNDPDKVGWYDENSGSTTHPVGTKAPNGLGLYDMSGNVWEWVQDIYADDAYGKHARRNPIYDGSSRVSRGGSWLGGARGMRSAVRYRSTPDGRFDSIGLRVVFAPPGRP